MKFGVRAAKKERKRIVNVSGIETAGAMIATVIEIEIVTETGTEIEIEIGRENGREIVEKNPETVRRIARRRRRRRERKRSGTEPCRWWLIAEKRGEVAPVLLRQTRVLLSRKRMLLSCDLCCLCDTFLSVLSGSGRRSGRRRTMVKAMIEGTMTGTEKTPRERRRKKRPR